MATHHPIRKVVPAAPPVIPDKLYFRIGDVARICEVPAYVLRFWETEFPQLKPNKGGTGQRLYRKRDVEMALRIKSLLYDQGYTIPGARQVFKAEAKSAADPIAAAAPLDLPQSLPQPEAAASLTIPESSLAARTLAPVPLPSAQPATSPAEIARRYAVESLRADLRDLLTMLSHPVSGSHPPVQRKPEPLQPLRPRLVLEPRPAREKDPAEARPRPRLHLHQPGLFGADDSGPTAS